MKRVNIEKWADTFRLIEERDQQTIAAIDYGYRQIHFGLETLEVLLS